MGVVERVVDVPPAFSAEGLRVLGGVTYYASAEKARRELDFSTRPFDDGWRETLAHEMRLAGDDGGGRG